MSNLLNFTYDESEDTSSLDSYSIMLTSCSCTDSGQCVETCTSDECLSTCTATCTATCTGCIDSGQCTAPCIRCTLSCTKSCTSSCTDTCIKSCTATCTSTCTSGSPCEDDCQSCEDTCIASCTKSCIATCTATCTETCTETCTASCIVTCTTCQSVCISCQSCSEKGTCISCSQVSEKCGSEIAQCVACQSLNQSECSRVGQDLRRHVVGAGNKFDFITEGQVRVSTVNSLISYLDKYTYDLMKNDGNYSTVNSNNPNISTKTSDDMALAEDMNKLINRFNAFFSTVYSKVSPGDVIEFDTFGSLQDKLNSANISSTYPCKQSSYPSCIGAQYCTTCQNSEKYCYSTNE